MAGPGTFATFNIVSDIVSTNIPNNVQPNADGTNVKNIGSDWGGSISVTFYDRSQKPPNNPRMLLMVDTSSSMAFQVGDCNGTGGDSGAPAVFCDNSMGTINFRTFACNCNQPGTP